MHAQRLLRGSLAIAAAAFLLGACAPNESPEVARGWSDGCSSGYHDGHGPRYGGVYMKQRRQYESDAIYRQAWDDAYARCHAMPYPMMSGGF